MKPEIGTARNHGGARKTFIAAVAVALKGLEQGRGSAASIEDIKRAYEVLQKRITKKRKER